jgi:hypothetical protein
MLDDERRMTEEKRPPRLRLIRVFLSVVAGFMAGLVGWTVVMMSVMLSLGPAAPVRFPALPTALQAVAFAGPALAAGCWLYAALGSPRGEAD